MAKLRTEASVQPTTAQPADPVARLLSSDEELYARCPLHGLCGAFVARLASGRGVVACDRCKRVLIEWKEA